MMRPVSERRNEGLILRRGFLETFVLTFFAQLLDGRQTEEERLAKIETINCSLLAMLRGLFLIEPLFKEVFIDCLKDAWKDRFSKLLFPVDKKLADHLAKLPNVLFEYIWEHREEWIPYSELRYDEKIREKVWGEVQLLVFDAALSFLVRSGFLQLD